MIFAAVKFRQLRSSVGSPVLFPNAAWSVRTLGTFGLQAAGFSNRVALLVAAVGGV
jgi:hypothetical protein